MEHGRDGEKRRSAVRGRETETVHGRDGETERKKEESRNKNQKKQEVIIKDKENVWIGGEKNPNFK